ncbi:MAG: N-acetyltransferase [Proteobacteria bacterium]|nr:N-acetyltransferase [Pseudomonadota bacterium]MBI3499360.1 N-acetyltransferase [Pseudomonadota bacterium]
MFTIMPERAEHGPEIDAFLDDAFGADRTAKTVYRLRKGTAAIAELCNVALSGGRLVGSIRFWPVVIAGGRAALLGPLVVAPELQGRGIGKALVTHGLERAAALGYGLSVLVGSPVYYRPFGFVPAIPLGLSLPGPVDPERFQVRELQPGWLALARGPVMPERVQSRRTA